MPVEGSRGVADPGPPGARRPGRLVWNVRRLGRGRALLLPPGAGINIGQNFAPGMERRCATDTELSDVEATR
jgi:hypothetical protein